MLEEFSRKKKPVQRLEPRVTALVCMWYSHSVDFTGASGIAEVEEVAETGSPSALVPEPSLYVLEEALFKA
jgi:hypothetical protein